MKKRARKAATKKKRAGKDRPKKPRARLTKAGREALRRAIAHGIKPVKNIKDLALLKPEDGDELLEAIRENRRWHDEHR